MKKIVKYLSNMPGWTTKRKIVVIESDDWGSLGISSISAYKKIENSGINVGKGISARYSKFDTLASSEDLSALYEVLSSVKDANGQSAKLTALCLGANPDFDKIRNNNFSEYFYEPFTETLNRTNKLSSLELWRQGIEESLFVPEFHGREHINIQPWLRALQRGDKEATICFNHEFWGYTRKDGGSFRAAFDLELSSDLNMQEEIVRDGLDLFEELHGYSARFFVPPNGPINNSLEGIAAEAGIKYMSTPKVQREVFGEGKQKKHFRFLGQRNTDGQIYITRNAFFEPTGSGRDEVANCIKDIAIAFKMKKPAVISSHRVNYIGSLHVENKDQSLRKLSALLKAIVKLWPDVEFMTSSELGETIIQTKNDK